MQKFTVPHCKHCKYFHQSTGDCILILQTRIHARSNSSAKARGSRVCMKFEVLSKFKTLYNIKGGS